MGYDYSLERAQFFVARQHQQAALVLLKRQATLGRSSDKQEYENVRIEGAETLPEALRGIPFGDWYWTCDLDLKGNIIGLDLTYERLRSSQEMFEVIAPFVTTGSFIIIQGEEGEAWAWLFNEHTVTYIEDIQQLPQCTFPHATPAPFTHEADTALRRRCLSKKGRADLVEEVTQLSPAAILPWLKHLLEQRNTREGDPGDLCLAVALRILTEHMQRRVDASHDGMLQTIIDAWQDTFFAATLACAYTRIEHLKEMAFIAGNGVPAINIALIAACLRLCQSPLPPVYEAAEDLLQLLQGLHATQDDASALIPTHTALPVLHGPTITSVPYSDEEVHRDLLQQTCTIFAAHMDDDVAAYFLDMLGSSQLDMVQSALQVLRSQAHTVPLERIRPLLHLQGAYPAIYHVSMALFQFLKARDDLPVLELLFADLSQATEQPYWLRIMDEALLRHLGRHAPVAWFAPRLQHGNDGHDHPWVRYAALVALDTRTPLPELLAALTDTWENSQARSLRRLALEILLRYQQPVPWQPILPYLKDKDIYVVEMAAAILKNQGQLVPVEILAQELGTTEGASTSERVTDVFRNGILIEALIPYGKQGPIQRMLDLLLHGQVQFSVTRPIHAPYRHEQVSLEALAPFLPIGEISQLAREGNTRWYALDVLGRLGKYTPVAELSELLQSPSSRDMHAKIMEVLARPGVPTPAEIFLQGLESQDRNVRLHAIAGMKHRHTQFSLSSWQQLLQHEDPNVRFTALEVLGLHQEERAMQALLSMLSDPLTTLRQSAENVLVRYEQIPLHLLEEALCVESALGRQAALRLVEHLGERVPRELLERVLHALGERVNRLASYPDTPLTLLIYAEQYWLLPVRIVLWKRQQRIQEIDQLLDALSNPALLKQIGLPVQETLETFFQRDPQLYERLKPELHALLLSGPSELASMPGRHIISQIFIHHCLHLAQQGQLSDADWQAITRYLNWHAWLVRVEALRTIARVQRRIPLSIVRHTVQLLSDPDSAAVRVAAREALSATLSLEPDLPEDLFDTP